MQKIFAEMEKIMGRELTGLEKVRARKQINAGMVNPYDVIEAIKIARG